MSLPIRVEQIFKDGQGRFSAFAGSDDNLLISPLHVSRRIHTGDIGSMMGVMLDVAFGGQRHAQFLRQSHFGVVANGHEDTIDGKLGPFLCLGMDQVNPCDLAVTPDFLDYGVKKNGDLIGREAFYKVILGPQGISPMDKRYIHADVLQIQRLRDRTVSAAHNYDFPPLEEGAIAGAAIAYPSSCKKGFPGHLETAVGLETFWTIPNDFTPMSLGIDRGNPAVLEAPKSKVSQNFKDLAECVCEMYGSEASENSIEAATS